MTVQINQDPRQTLTLYATKGFPQALYGLTRQLNYMSKCICMCACSYAVISTLHPMSWIFYSCIKDEQLFVSEQAMHIYVSVCFVSVCVFVHACGGKCVLCEKEGGGARKGTTISCVQVALFEGWLGGGLRTCRPCVWEPRAPHFSYIVLLVLQTVNATKDAQPIVAQDS